MHGHLIRQGVEGANPRDTTMDFVSVPDLVTCAISIAIVIFLWLQ